MTQATKRRQMFRCQICGNILESVFAAGGDLVCCGEPMQLIKPHTEEGEEVAEKHLPVLEVSEDGKRVRVKIGEVEHPMVEDHYIQWVELFAGDQFLGRRWLAPGEKPYAEFHLSESEKGEKLQGRCYCNVHGAWLAS
jgi:superoxide reductase